MTAKNPPNYLFSTNDEHIHWEDLRRRWDYRGELAKRTAFEIRHISRRIRENEVFQKLYNPRFTGLLIPKKTSSQEGSLPDWDLTGRFLRKEITFNVVIYCQSTQKRNRIGAGEKFRVAAEIEGETPPAELKIEEITFSKDETKSNAFYIWEQICYPHIESIPKPKPDGEFNQVREVSLDVSVKVLINGESVIKTTQITIVYPKIISSRIVYKDYSGGILQYDPGGQLPNRSLEPDDVNYGELYFAEGKCTAEVTGIYEHLSEEQKIHTPHPVTQLDGNAIGSDDCHLVTDKSLYLKGTKGTYTWLIPQCLGLNSRNLVPFAYLEQKFTCQVTSDEKIDKIIHGKRHKRKLEVLFTVSKNGFTLATSQTIYDTQKELDEYLGTEN